MSMRAKPFTPAGRDREKDECSDDRDDVRVDDRVEALAVTVRDGGAHRFAGAPLFLDALEDDDVRVHRDSDREDQAGEARGASSITPKISSAP